MWFTTSRLNHSRERRKKVQTLSEEEKLKVEKIVFLLDKFFVGDAFYHKIFMITDGLPRSYLALPWWTEQNVPNWTTKYQVWGGHIKFSFKLCSEYICLTLSSKTVTLTSRMQDARMTRNPNLFYFHLLFCKQRSQVCLLTKYNSWYSPWNWELPHNKRVISEFIHWGKWLDCHR